MKIVCDADKISIASQNGVENVYWSKERLKQAFEKKYKNKFVYVKAETRGTGKTEEFRYVEAYEVSGFDYNAMIKLLEEGKIIVDLRIGQYTDGRTHNHGTGFRIKEIDHHLLFKTRRRIG